MKICFPVEENIGLESPVYGQFGVTTENGINRTLRIFSRFMNRFRRAKETTSMVGYGL